MSRDLSRTALHNKPPDLPRRLGDLALLRVEIGKYIPLDCAQLLLFSGLKGDASAHVLQFRNRAAHFELFGGGHMTVWIRLVLGCTPFRNTILDDALNF